MGLLQGSTLPADGGGFGQQGPGGSSSTVVSVIGGYCGGLAAAAPGMLVEALGLEPTPEALNEDVVKEPAFAIH